MGTQGALGSMVWSQEEVLKFLEAYRKEPCIWNIKHPEHKNRSSVAIAWSNVHKSLNFDCTINDLKRKKESLMASFRLLFNKKRKRMNSGLSDKFEPHWYAYEAMEQFLGPMYLGRPALTETASADGSEMFEEGIDNFKIEEISNNDTEFTISSIEEISDIAASDPFSQKQKLINTSESEGFFDGSCDLIDVNKLKRKHTDEDDECDLYGQLLAKKLRRFSERYREEIMFEIDGLIVQKRKSLQE